MRYRLGRQLEVYVMNSKTEPMTEEVVFIEEPQVVQYGSGNPPSLAGRWYVFRKGYYFGDAATEPRTFYLQRSQVWSTDSKDGLFATELEALIAVRSTPSQAIAWL